MNDFEQFSARIRKNPDDLEAWKGLLALVNDPEKKRECQEHIERIMAKQQATPLICPQCGGGMNIHFAEELHDKRAKCPYCGTEVDLPDPAPRAVINTRTGSGQLGSGIKLTFKGMSITIVVILMMLPAILPCMAMVVSVLTHAVAPVQTQAVVPVWTQEVVPVQTHVVAAVKTEGVFPVKTEAVITAFADLPQTATTGVQATPEWASATSVPSGSTYPLLSVTIAVSSPQPMINIPSAEMEPRFQGDLTWNKTAFASSYYAEGYPACATSGCAWRSASSTGSWFYVDLGEPYQIERLVTTLFVDANLSSAPQTAFIVSNDLEEWRVVFQETNPNNSSQRGMPRTLTLPEVVTARYVSFYATDWGGGWADLSVFSVLPPSDE